MPSDTAAPLTLRLAITLQGGSDEYRRGAVVEAIEHLPGVATVEAIDDDQGPTARPIEDPLVDHLIGQRYTPVRRPHKSADEVAREIGAILAEPYGVLDRARGAMLDE